MNRTVDTKQQRFVIVQVGVKHVEDREIGPTYTLIFDHNRRIRIRNFYRRNLNNKKNPNENYEVSKKFKLTWPSSTKATTPAQNIIFNANPKRLISVRFIIKFRVELMHDN